MNLPYGMSTEEGVAYQLADLAVQLHKCGMIDSYNQVVQARNDLLEKLDARDMRRAKQRRTSAGRKPAASYARRNPLHFRKNPSVLQIAAVQAA